MVDPNDAPNVKIPMLMIPSQDEPKDDVDKYQKGLTVPNQVEWFNEQIHGFMAARANLEDPKVSSAYEKGYQILLNWFHDQL